MRTKQPISEHLGTGNDVNDVGIRSRLTYANVMATVAMMIAVSGWDGLRSQHDQEQRYRRQRSPLGRRAGRHPAKWGSAGKGPSSGLRGELRSRQ
jgi:hypothetical protein